MRDVLADAADENPVLSGRVRDRRRIAAGTALVDDHVWVWPRRSTERTLNGMGFALVGQEDPEVLAERVLLAQATYKARRAA